MLNPIVYIVELTDLPYTNEPAHFVFTDEDEARSFAAQAEDDYGLSTEVLGDESTLFEGCDQALSHLEAMLAE